MSSDCVSPDRGTPVLAGPVPRGKRVVYHVVPKEHGPGLEIRAKAVPRFRWSFSKPEMSSVSRLALTGMTLAEMEGAERAEGLLSYAWARREVIRRDQVAAQRLSEAVFTVRLVPEISLPDVWGVPMLATFYTQVLIDLKHYEKAQQVLATGEGKPDPSLVQTVHVLVALGEFEEVLTRTNANTSMTSDLDAFMMVQRATAFSGLGRTRVARRILEELFQRRLDYAPSIRYRILYECAWTRYCAGNHDEALEALDEILLEESRLTHVGALYDMVQEARGASGTGRPLGSKPSEG